MLILLAPSLGCMTPMANLWTPALYVRWNMCTKLEHICNRCTSCTPWNKDYFLLLRAFSHFTTIIAVFQLQFIYWKEDRKITCANFCIKPWKQTMYEGQSQGKFKIHIFCVLCCQLQQEYMCTCPFVGVLKT